MSGSSLRRKVIAVHPAVAPSCGRSPSGRPESARAPLLCAGGRAPARPP